ncbi:MAG: TonB-dependent receptor [Sphingobacteriia bacterium]|nr:MAG: TonB-dependent receptor [Sphingobacteriia bacterium]
MLVRNFLCVLCLSGVVSSQAQQLKKDIDSSDAKQLAEVIVTAEKRLAPLQTTSAAVTAISAAQVNVYRLWNIKDITGIVPNLYAGNSGDGRNVSAIRGITTTSYDPAITTYIDGVNQFSLDTYIPQLQDIERIEILRGPQGTLYGRNAMGGVINIITKQPTNSTNGFAEINLGSYNQQRYNAGIRMPLIKNKLFVGAAALYTKRDGFYTNEFTGKFFDKQSGISGNYFLKWLPKEKWTITLNVKHQHNKNNGAFPLINGVQDALNNPFKLNQNAVGEMDDRTLNASLSIQYAGSKINVNNQFAWQQNKRIYNSPIDADFSPLDAITISNNYDGQWNKVKVFTHEMNISSVANKSKKLEWTAGTYFFHQINPTKQATNFGKDAVLIGMPDIDFSSINTSNGINTGFALFGQINYKLSSKLSLIAGLRNDYESRKLTVKGEYQKLGQPAITTTPDTTATELFTALSPKLGLNYQLNTASNLYAVFNRGFRTGGFTQLSLDPSQPPLYAYKPEYSSSVELGIKNRFFNNRFLFNATIFYTVVKNAQVPTLVLPDAITVIKNTGRMISSGAELELIAKPAKGWHIEYNAGYTNAEYQSLKIAANGGVENFDGKKQIFTPNITSMLALQYSYLANAARNIQLMARCEWLYLGTRYFDLANNIRQQPTNMVNTRVGITTPKLEIFFWGRNIFNQKYIEYAYDFGGVHLANPANFGFGVKTIL